MNARIDLLCVTRSVRFSAAHRYHRPELSDEQNRELFGACFHPHGHGHNYRVDVSVEGRVDPVTGMVINLAELDALLKEEIVKRFDHRFINYDIDHFAEVVPTCENIALYLGDRLLPLIEATGAGRLARVRVWESDDLYSEIAYLRKQQ
jgi:6-pyruvoyltetrahydropterin/6-carboxytetrahydropterin synthase